MDIALTNHNKIINKTDTNICKQTMTKYTYVTKLKNEDDIWRKLRQLLTHHDYNDGQTITENAPPPQSPPPSLDEGTPIVMYNQAGIGY